LETIADLTGADVAASTDLTGHRSLGGDWELERQTGPIEPPGVIGDATRASWTQILALNAYEPFAYSTGSLNYQNGVFHVRIAKPLKEQRQSCGSSTKTLGLTIPI
jgi:hypothetical protein